MKTFVEVAAAALLILATAAGAAGDPELEAYFESVHTLTGSFVQQTRDERGEVVERASGRFAVARPDRFDWRYEEPYEQRIVADGEWLWVYDVDLDQVTVRPMDEVLGVGPALLLSGDYERLQETFRIEPAADGWIRLVPLKGQWDFQSVRLLMESGVPGQIELDDGLGQITRLTLSGLTRNPEIDPERFDFRPPPGVDVVAPPEFPGAGE